jgi:hypothetical protein
MGIVKDILTYRWAGAVHCRLSMHPSPALDALAREVNLSDDLKSYFQIDTAPARRLLQLVLARNLAYSEEIMSFAHAAEIAKRSWHSL